MPWNGSGSFSRDNGTNTGLTVWEDDFNVGTKIRADNHDTHDQDIADGIEACLAKNGENAMTGALNMGGQKATNAAVGTAASDLSTLAQVQANTVSYAADGGAANAYTVSLSPAATAYTAGMQVCFKVANTNTGASTINVNALGVKNIFVDGAAVTGGELMAGDMVELRYDGTQFQVVSFPRRKRHTGASGSVAGPHIEHTFDGDSDAALHLFAWTHDNVHIAFDAHYDGSNWISSDVGSNFKIGKSSDVLNIDYESGVAASGTATFSTALSFDVNGNVSLPSDSNGSTTNMILAGSGSPMRIYHDASNVSRVETTSGQLQIQNTANGQTVRIYANDVGGTLRNMITCDPDTGTEFWVLGTQYGEISADGVQAVAGGLYAGPIQAPAIGAYGFRATASGSVRAYNASGATSIVHRFGGSAGQVYIYGDGDLENTNNSYGAISDERHKKDIKLSGSQWDDIKNVPVIKYKLKSGGDSAKVHLGTSAQGLIDAGMGGLVTENDEGVLSVKYSILYMKAVGALKEALNRIEALEGRNAALEARLAAIELKLML